MSNPFDSIDPDTPTQGNPFDAVDPPQPAPQGDASKWGPSMEAANAAMFGMGPTINQWMTGVPKGQQEADAKAWEAKNSAPMGADGSFMSIKGPGWSPSEAGLADTVGGSIPYAAAGAATGGAGFIPETLAQAGVGAAGNSLLPLSQGQNPSAAALAGAMTGAGGKIGGDLAGSLMGVAGRGVAGAFKPPVNVPTAAGVQAAKNAAYDVSEEAGDMASPEGLQRLKAALTGTMADYGYDPALQPGGQAVVNRMNSFAEPPAPPPSPGYTVTPTATPGGGPMPLYTGSSPAPAIPGSIPPSAGTPIGSPPVAGMTLKGLDGLRQVVNRMREGGPSGSNLARQLTGNIDDFVNNPQPGDWLGEDGPQGSDSLNAARKLAQIGFKSDAMEEALERGQDSAAVSGSGGNANNTQARAAKNLKWSDQNWTTDEQAAQQAMIQGAPGPIRALSKLDAAGHGLGMAATLGMALSEAVPLLALGHPGAAAAATAAAATPAILGAAAKKLATSMGDSKEQILRGTILNGGVNPYGPSAAQRSISSATPALKRGIGSTLAAAMSGGQQ